MTYFKSLSKHLCWSTKQLSCFLLYMPLGRVILVLSTASRLDHTGFYSKAKIYLFVILRELQI